MDKNTCQKCGHELVSAPWSDSDFYCKVCLFECFNPILPTDPGKCPECSTALIKSTDCSYFTCPACVDSNGKPYVLVLNPDMVLEQISDLLMESSRYDFNKLCELIGALDEHLQGGGELPRAWKKHSYLRLPEPSKTEALEIFHRLWGKDHDRETYDKEEWMKLGAFFHKPPLSDADPNQWKTEDVGRSNPQPDDSLTATSSDTAHLGPFTTVRACIDCGVLISGGPTRCRYCADHNHVQNDIISSTAVIYQPGDRVLFLGRKHTVLDHASPALSERGFVVVSDLETGNVYSVKKSELTPDPLLYSKDLPDTF